MQPIPQGRLSPSRRENTRPRLSRRIRIASIVLFFCTLTSFFLAGSVSGLHADTLEARSRLSPSSRRMLVTAERQLNNTLLWGSYRPQNYVGFRPRLPKSVLMGLAWADVTTFESAVTGLRHQCDDRQDVMYKWTRHDGERFGEQEIRDEKANVEFTTSFVKVLPSPLSSEAEVNETASYEDTLEGGSWALRISGKAIDPRRPAQLTFLTYFATEAPEMQLTLENEEDEKALGIPWEEGVHLTGTGPGLGDFNIKIKHTSAGDLKGESASPASDDLHNQPVTTGAGVQNFASRLQRTQFGGWLLGYDQTWRARDTIIASFNYALQRAMKDYNVQTPHAGMNAEQMARERSKLPASAYLMQLASSPMDTEHPNLIVFQDTFDLNPSKRADGKLGSFSFDIYFESQKDTSAEKLPNNAKALTQALQQEREAFDQKFQELVPMSLPYAHSTAVKQGSVSDTVFARELISSAIGGVGYFFGEQVVDRSQSAGDDEEAGEGVIDIARKESNKAALGDKIRMEGPYELTTGTPGRSIFPRGFYWDEGFHLAAISTVNNDLSLAILKSWFDLVDEDGWVGRELALGTEAASRVPKEFLAQNPLHGNPPTLIMSLAMYIDRLAQKSEGGIGADASLGMQGQMAFNTGDSDLSGRSQFLKDRQLGNAYLRTLYPALRRHYLWFRSTQKGELKEWGRSATARGEAYRWRGRSKDGHVFASGLDDYPRATIAHSGELHLDLHCWMGFFADTMMKIAEAVGEDDDMDEYERHQEGIVANLDDLHWNEARKMYCDATISATTEENEHVCHAGYVSIFPLLLGLLAPDNPHLKAVMDLVRDEKQIWSKFGLLSLSRSDPYYETKEGYWRGPVWMPLNYLALRGLKKYATVSGPYQAQAAKLYSELRENVVQNVRKEYARTGYSWEQYNATTGQGQRGHPFTGWTSLVALAMGEVY